MLENTLLVLSGMGALGIINKLLKVRMWLLRFGEGWKKIFGSLRKKRNWEPPMSRIMEEDLQDDE